MSRIEVEVEKALLELSENGTEGASAVFVFPADFVGFEGHFPSGKVLPGVCQIQCVLAVLSKWKGLNVRLKEVQRAKFLNPVLPDERLAVVLREPECSDGECTVKAVLSVNGNKVSEIKLRMIVDEAG